MKAIIILIFTLLFVPPALGEEIPEILKALQAPEQVYEERDPAVVMHLLF